MSYKLKLTKTQMYKLIEEVYPVIPPMRKCDFSHSGATYWMDFYLDGDHIKVTIQTVLGETSMVFENMSEGGTCFFKVQRYTGQYLLGNGLLQEVKRRACV